MAKVAPANSVLAPLLLAKLVSFEMETTAFSVTVVLPLGRMADAISLYDLMLPLLIVTISSFTISSFKIVVLADTNVPYACSIALLNAIFVASSFVAPSAETVNVTSSFDFILSFGLFSLLFIVSCASSSLDIGTNIKSSLDSVFIRRISVSSVLLCCFCFFFFDFFSNPLTTPSII